MPSTTVKPQTPLAYWMGELKFEGERAPDLIRSLTTEDKADMIEYATVEMTVLGVPIKEAQAKAA